MMQGQLQPERKGLEFLKFISETDQKQKADYAVFSSGTEKGCLSPQNLFQLKGKLMTSLPALPNPSLGTLSGQCALPITVVART